MPDRVVNEVALGVDHGESNQGLNSFDAAPVPVGGGSAERT